MSFETDRLERVIRKLEKDLKDLNTLFVKNDEELRRKLRDIRITGMAGVVATEYTLANRMGITMDVVMALLPTKDRLVAEKEIERRIAQCPETSDIALRIATKKYAEEGDDY